VFLLGNIATKVVDSFVDDFKDWRQSIPIMDSIDETGTLIGGLIQAAQGKDVDVTEEDIMAALFETATNITEVTTGVPVANVVRWGTQIGEFTEDPTVKNAIGAFNVTDYAIGEMDSKKKPKGRFK
jgi:hypothetical protein